MLRGSWESRSRNTRLEPMKPAEPVMRMVLVFCDIDFIVGRESPCGIPLKPLLVIFSPPPSSAR